MGRCLVYSCLVAALALTGFSAAALRADDEPAEAPAKKSATRKGAKSDKSEADEWKELVARRKELMKEVETLDKQARTADEAGKKKVFLRFQELEAEFKTDLQPRFLKLAPKIFEKDPTDPDAAEVMVARAFQEFRHPDVISIVTNVLEAGKTSAPLLTFMGVSQFETNDFENAKKTLEEAQEADKQIFPRLGAPYLAMCDKYVDYWKRETELREKEEKAGDLPRVLLKTKRGDIELELFENEAPNTVANFVSLVEKKKYDGVAFHRVEPGFVTQGGDPNTLDDDPGNDGQGGPGYRIVCECYTDNARMHFQGSLSMAHAGKDTGGSQFFLTHRPTDHLNYTKGKTQNNHTVFGRIVKGMDVALALKPGDKIESAKVLRKRDHDYVPETLPENDRPRAKKSKG